MFLEFDGRLKYRLFRRANETLEQFLMREKRREELICQLTGWVCVRITLGRPGEPGPDRSAHQDAPGQSAAARSGR